MRTARIADALTVPAPPVPQIRPEAAPPDMRSGPCKRLITRYFPISGRGVEWARPSPRPRGERRARRYAVRSRPRCLRVASSVCSSHCPRPRRGPAPRPPPGHHRAHRARGRRCGVLPVLGGGGGRASVRPWGAHRALSRAVRSRPGCLRVARRDAALGARRRLRSSLRSLARVTCTRCAGSAGLTSGRARRPAPDSTPPQRRPRRRHTGRAFFTPQLREL